MINERSNPGIPEVRRTAENRYLTDDTFINRLKDLFADRANYPNFLSVISVLRRELRISDDPKSHVQVLKRATKDGVLSPELDGVVVESLRGDLQHVGHHTGTKFLERLRDLAEHEQIAPDVVQLIERYSELSKKVQEITERVDTTNALLPQDVGILEEREIVQNQLMTSEWPHASKLLHYFDSPGLKWLWGVDENTELVPDDGRIGDQQMYRW